MKKTFLLVFLAGLFSCQQKQVAKAPEPQIDPKKLISCDGIGEAKLSDTYADLEKKFGAAALSEHENTELGKYTTLWENKPEQINIFWEEKSQPYKRIKYMEATDAMSSYLTKDSVRIGLTLREVVKKNGSMPVTFRNFYAEEQSGLITTFNNGEITKVTPCLGGKLEWVKQTNIYAAEHENFKKQEVLESYDKLLQRMEVVLSSIRVSAKQ
ncbi:hypothetical protein [Pedobacter sp. SYSU D00535]|uniref:hypothetical protein n=1 Tax=Pedobacter sp. SYSU D00535 TaxID=2810308 RepID=UPI001A961985|nr:hypothetical protein [Pedobacter sp. SYSU D00535]